MHIPAKWPARITTWLSMGIIVLLSCFVYFWFTRYNAAALSESRAEGVLRLRAVFHEVRRYRATAISPRNGDDDSDEGPDPFDATAFAGTKTDCPIISYLTGNRCSSPFLVVY